MNDGPAPITVRHTFGAACHRVFEAWVDPAVASRWLFATPDGRIVRCEIDARPGGALVVTDRRAGEDVEHVGNFLEVEPPRHLAFTFGVPRYSNVMTRVVLDLAEAGAGCEATLVHHGVLAEWAAQTEQGWRDLLSTLDGLLRPASA